MKILVVRFKQIGDAILAAPVCKTLKKTFPDAQIDYVLYEHISPLFEKSKYIDNVISITKEEQKNILKYIKKAWKVTRNNYDIVIDIMSTPKSEVFTLFSGKSKYRIGRAKKKRGFTYTHKIEEPKISKNKIDKFLQMLKPLEAEYKIEYDEDFSIELEKSEIDMMHRRMEEAGVDFSRPVFAFAINSRVPGKVFDIDKMLGITKNISRDLNPQIIFYYSESEKEFAKKAHERLDWDKNIFSNIKTATIRELAMLLKNCDMFFGNEGGPRHLAQAVDIPAFVIARPGLDVKEWIIASEKNGIVRAGDIVNREDLTLEEENEILTVEVITEKLEEFYREKVEKNKK